jgi:hypothetical protein
VRWYEKQRRGLGTAFSLALEKALTAIESDPARYPGMDNPPRNRNIHFYLLWQYPYIIHYEIRADEILVLAISHTSRRPGYWRRRKK